MGSLSDMVKNIGSVGPAALIGTQPMRNVPGAAAAVPAAAAQVAPQQPPQSQLQPQPGPWQYYKYDTPQMLQAYINAIYEKKGPRYGHDDTETTNSNLYLDSQLDVLLANPKFHWSLFKDIKFPPVKYLNLQGIKKLESLQYFNFPDSLTELVVFHTGVNSLFGVKFPPNLIRLRLDHNQINSLDGVEFPFSLQSLDLTNNQIKSLNGVKFPPNLTYLGLSNNNITSLLGAHFPPNLTRLSLGGNPISSLKGMIDPSPNVMQLLGEVLPTQFNYFREKSASKAARQSQKADLNELTGLTQKSTITMLKTLTAFFREGMEARARQHEEQMVKEVEERGKAIILIRGPTGKTYTVPLNTAMSIQAVLDYLNSHYYISALEDCGVMHLIFSGQRLEPERTLADYNVQAESTLHLMCKFRPNLFQGGSKKRRPKKSKKCKKRSQKQKRSNKFSKK
jgi:hypothetical protein